MLFLNDTKDFKDAKSNRLKLCVNLPFDKRSIVLPPKPLDELKKSSWDIFKEFVPLGLK